jgi:type VI secretion system protein ImpC
LTRAIGALLDEASADVAPEHFDEVQVDTLIAALDRRCSAQLDSILHHPEFQALEATWRGLYRLVGRIEFDQNILVEFLSCSKEDLFEDFSAAPEVPRSGLYHLVYNLAFGVFGGQPYGILCTSYEFGPGAEDLSLLRYCAEVAAIAHAPFIANASPSLFGLDDFGGLPRLREPAGALAGARFRLWHAFRATENARYVALCLPKVLLREPYDTDMDPSLPLRYCESRTRGHDDMLWGPAAFECTAIAAASFARYRWSIYMLGSRAASIATQLRWDYPTLRGLWHRCPLECQVTGRIEHALAEEGFICMVYERAKGRASLLSAPSARAPAHFGERADQRAMINERLGAQLPYIFLVCRLAHYLKCVQREKVGQWLDSSALERELVLWLRKYVSDQDDAQWEVRARKPLREASVKVEAVEGQTGWYRCHLRLRPHLTHNNAAFTLSLVGKLDRPVGETAART